MKLKKGPKGFPKSLSIRNTTYDILRYEGLIDEAEVYGKTQFAHPAILVEHDMDSTVIAETILHEILHVCFFHAGYSASSKVEEAAVLALTAPLIDVMRQNPEVFKYIIEEG